MGVDCRVRDRRDRAVTGNLYVLLGLAEAIVSHLPVAVRRSTILARRMSDRRTALIGRMKTSLGGIRGVGRCIDSAGANAARVREALAP